MRLGNIKVRRKTLKYIKSGKMKVYRGNFLEFIPIQNEDEILIKKYERIDEVLITTPFKINNRNTFVKLRNLSSNEEYIKLIDESVNDKIMKNFIVEPPINYEDYKEILINREVDINKIDDFKEMYNMQINCFGFLYDDSLEEVENIDTTDIPKIKKMVY